MAITVLIALVGIGCGGMGDQKPAIEKAIKDHLASRSDLAINNMTMDVKEVKVEPGNKDKAGAEVLFRVTNAPEMQMGYHYDLAREGGTWKVVEGRPAAADSKHPGGDADPNNVDPSALPPGHPPMPGATQGGPQGNSPDAGALPPGHP